MLESDDVKPNPWRDVPLRAIAIIVAPFWLYYAFSSVIYGLLVYKQITGEDIAARLLQYAVLLPFIVLCYKLALRIGWSSPPSWRIIVAQLALALGFAASGRFVLWATFSLMMWDPSWMTSQRMELVPELRMIGASLLDQLLAYLAGLALLIGVLTFRRLREVTLRAERAEREYVTARLQALRGQLNPHFLFNTLHSVCGLVDDRPGTARTMLVRLGDLLRSTFRDEGQEEVPLAEELDLVRSYLDIQKLRFSDRLVFSVDVEAGLEMAVVPRFLLQPLAENAIMHGMADEQDRVDIRISARKTDVGLELSVVNSSTPAPAMSASSARSKARVGSGVGLGNTAERLRALYSERATLHYQPDGASGFLVCVRLPIETAEPAAAT
jgi:two-component system, LytTR family, sensor kinase